MRIRSVLGAAVATAALLLSAGVAHAITNGSPDGSAHPAVGGLVADQAYSDGTWIYCSGSLISPTVFLTAAHCGEGGSDRVRVTFSTAYQDGDTTYSGTFHADPAYGGGENDPHDVAVVVLDKSVKGVTPVQLPAADSLSGLKSGAEITMVGYGAYAVPNGPGGHQYLYNDIRMSADGTLNSISPAWLRISENPATGNGGGCYGDSGGPNFLAGTNIEAATTITGDALCRSTNTAYRLDTASARDFLGQYLTLP
ncbi:MAG TPA: trypsin-like serine protease [Nocardioides sp.]|uniref:trypsin-like serine peptidase n=1 Tax=Nocardioides sp. TaxID=35761 RepID=UPI002F40B4BA